jgi:hypothetical protein
MIVANNAMPAAILRTGLTAMIESIDLVMTLFSFLAQSVRGTVSRQSNLNYELCCIRGST